MNRPSNSSGLGEGVYYGYEMYAGFFRRLLILAIDLTLILLAGTILYLPWYAVMPETEAAHRWFLSLWLATGYFYLVFVESSSIGTVGFLLTGVKIVNLKGERPSLLRMTFRLLLWGLGPFHPLIDLLWLSGDPNRQTLRDKLAGTYVVRKNAIPCGKGIVRAAHYYLFGFSILFPEVQRPRAIGGAP